jgi:hypothetical protein
MLKKFSKLLALIIVLSVTAILLWQDNYLTAEYNGKLLFTWKISAGESFEVTFLHSLNLSPVTDVIEWDGSDLIVRKSIFETFGGGVPSPLADGVGTELVSVNGRYELIGINAHKQKFSIMTQDIPNHRISHNGREANLLELVGSGKLVHIEVKRMPLIVFLLTL